MRATDVEDIYGLSPLQQGLFFHALQSPDSGLYFEQASLPWQGGVNVPALRKAWETILKRHPILRTSFYWEEADKPIQVVRRNVELPFQQLDWRGISAAEQQARLQSFLLADRERGFVLTEPPLMRVTLIQAGEASQQLIWSFHHLLLDGWSVLTVFNQVSRLYYGYCQGQDVSLEPSRPFRDYIAWLNRQDVPAAEAYWRRVLEGFRAPTPLLAAAPAAPRGTAEFADETTYLSAETTSALQEFARRQKLTLNTLVQAAWALLLSRYSGEDDVVFGTIVSGRPAELEGVQSMVGLFINTLPVPRRIPSEASLVDWLQELQQDLARMRQYEYSSLVQVQGWSSVPRGSPLFHSIVAFENYPGIGDASLAARERDEQVRFIERTNYPLAVMAAPGRELMIRVLYDAHLFDQAAIRRLLGHLESLLKGFCADPQQRPAELPLLTEAERRTVLAEFNQTRTEYPRDTSIPELFEIQAERTPDAVAVVFKDRKLSYRELNERANQLAHRLIGHGVRPETMVGVLAERSLDLMVALLGVLKAGGAYVPLDPSYPQQRLTFMLEDVQAPLVVVQEQYREQIPARAAQLISLDAERSSIAAESTANPRVELRGQHLAYVTYTSGSTGKPKGVCVEHQSVVRLVKGTNYAEFAADEVFLQLAPVAFDASTLEIWGPLLNGARVVVMPPRTPSLEELGSALVRHRITTLFLTTGLFNQMVDDQMASLRQLRHLMTGGEVHSVRHIQRAVRELGRCKLTSVYGPTENTTFTSFYPIEQETQIGDSVSIGKPIANSTAYVLDSRLQPVPVGVPGELCIGGDGVARGYWNRPDLSREKFVRDPFSDDPDGRLYKSGDLARWMPDGNLEFLGRIDRQIKLRGFRVELGEIEAVLSQHPAIASCVVLDREDTPGDKRLVAYVVSSGGDLAVEELRAFLADKLPEYMVPAAFLQIEKTPLTANGKVDRDALPPPDWTPNATQREHVPPHNPTEATLAELWEEVLGVKQVGVHDNFFTDLGGHSLLATQVVSRIRGRFEVELPLHRFFEAPAIAELAVVIESLILDEIEALEEQNELKPAAANP